MRIAVAGATGNIGSLVAAALERDGHEVVRLSRSLGVDLVTGDGLDDALAGVETVVDTTNAPAGDRASTVAYFGAMTQTLLDAGARAGVRHHVLLSIAAAARVHDNPHYAGKQEQERLVSAGRVPWTIVPATQFHDFAEMVTSRAERDAAVPVAPLLLQPVAPADVAAVLAEVAVGQPRGRDADVAGPETQDMVDMARRSHEARGRHVRLVPTWSGPFGLEMAGNAMLPGEGARIMPTTFEEWLAGSAAAGS